MGFVFPLLIGVLIGIFGFYFFMAHDDSRFVSEPLERIINFIKPQAIGSELPSPKQIRAKQRLIQQQLLEYSKFVDDGMRSFRIIFEKTKSQYATEIDGCSRLT